MVFALISVLLLVVIASFLAGAYVQEKTRHWHVPFQDNGGKK